MAGIKSRVIMAEKTNGEANTPQADSGAGDFADFRESHDSLPAGATAVLESARCYGDGLAGITKRFAVSRPRAGSALMSRCALIRPE